MNKLFFFFFLGSLFVLVYFFSPNGLTVPFFIFIVGLVIHFFWRLFRIERPFLRRIGWYYFPLTVSWGLFLAWQRIFEPLFGFVFLVLVIVVELFIRQYSI